MFKPLLSMNRESCKLVTFFASPQTTRFTSADSISPPASPFAVPVKMFAFCLQVVRAFLFSTIFQSFSFVAASLGLIGCIDEGNTVGSLGHSISGDCANKAV